MICSLTFIYGLFFIETLALAIHILFKFELWVALSKKLISDRLLAKEPGQKILSQTMLASNRMQALFRYSAVARVAIAEYSRLAADIPLSMLLNMNEESMDFSNSACRVER